MYKPVGWNKPGYDSSMWENVKKAFYGYNNLVAQYGEPVRPIMELPCIEKSVSPKEKVIFDFGQAIAGGIRVKLKEPKGTKITFNQEVIYE